MAYCRKCGKGLPEGAEFCPACGATTKIGTGSGEMAAERIGRDRSLQNHWMKRLIAVVVDSIIVGIAAAVLSIAALFPLFLGNPLGFFN